MDHRYVAFDIQYTLAGEYTVNVSAWNGHRDLIYGMTKHIFNVTQDVVVQYAIVLFNDTSEELWIKDDGRELSSKQLDQNLDLGQVVCV